MACFLVPTAEAIVAAVATKAVKSGEQKDLTKIESESVTEAPEVPHKMPFSRKLRWLTNMLLGGAVLLCFEHLWHGEVVPFPPFLTAAADSGDTAEMLHEMSTVGVCMALLITAVWVGMVIVTNIMENKAIAEAKTAAQEV